MKLKTWRVTRFPTDCQEEDRVAVEEPLEIRLGQGGLYRPIAVTMRTPGEDEELAAGFLLTEAVIRSVADLQSVTPHGGVPNVMLAEVAPSVEIDWKRMERHFYATSSCGVCGKASIDRIRHQVPPIASDLRVRPELLNHLPGRLEGVQAAFQQTGGLHAAALFRVDGECTVTREDIGRHNALDKVIGWASLSDPDLPKESILLVSGRAGFEIVQKAAMAQIPVIAAIGAPSSLAVELAEELGITLIGFLRKDRFNTYSGSERVTSA